MVGTIEWVVEGVLKLLGPLQELSREKRELADDALRAISNALNETCLYCRHIKDGKARDSEAEARLARLWVIAAVPITHFNPKLGEICEYTPDHWINPNNWDKSKVKNLSISLEDVRAKYAALLRA